jgi:hypothetical protein
MQLQISRLWCLHDSLPIIKDKDATEGNGAPDAICFGTLRIPQPQILQCTSAENHFCAVASRSQVDSAFTFTHFMSLHWLAHQKKTL